MLRELLERRVPHIVGAYLAAGWLVLEFTDWVVNRYVLSSHLTDFVVAGWLLLLPAVFMVAWFHGKPGRDSWTRFEQVGIAINLGVAIGAIAGDAGTGAAIGAVAGGVRGRRAKKMAEEQAAQAGAAQAEAAADEQLNSFKRAMSVCLEGRGYTVQ